MLGPSNITEKEMKTFKNQWHILKCSTDIDWGDKIKFYYNYLQSFF